VSAGVQLAIFGFLVAASLAVPNARDANGTPFTCYGVDAAGHGNPGCATASTAGSKSKGQSSAAATKTGGARAGEAINPKQTHVFLAAKVEPPKVKTLEAKPVELNPVVRAGKDRYADDSAEEAENRERKM